MLYEDDDTKLLHEAIQEGDIQKAIKSLITPDYIYAQDEDGMTAFYAAMQLGRTDILKLFINKGAQIGGIANPPLVDVLGMYNDLVCERKMDPTKANIDTDNLLKEYADIANLFIEKGANVQAYSGNASGIGFTFAIQHAANTGLCPIVQKMLDQGANVNGKNCYAITGIADSNNFEMTTPLHYAFYNKDIPMISLLAVNGADIYNAWEDDTPYELAKKWGDEKALQILEAAKSRIEAAAETVQYIHEHPNTKLPDKFNDEILKDVQLYAETYALRKIIETKYDLSESETEATSRINFANDFINKNYPPLNNDISAKIKDLSLAKKLVGDLQPTTSGTKSPIHTPNNKPSPGRSSCSTL